MDELKEFLDLYSLEEVFEVLDIEPIDVLTILYEGGHIAIPDFLKRDDDAEQQES